MSLLEDHILDEGLGNDVLLLDLTLLVHGLTDHDTLGLGLEQHAAGGDVLRTAVILRGGADAAESHFEDADAFKFHLLAQFEVVFHGTTQLVEHGLDVGFLDRCLLLDVVGQFLGLDEVLVVDCRGEPLAVGGRFVVLVLKFGKFLRHVLN